MTWKVSAPKGGANLPFLRARTGKWVILKALRSNAFKITFQVVYGNVPLPKVGAHFHVLQSHRNRYNPLDIQFITILKTIEL